MPPWASRGAAGPLHHTTASSGTPERSGPPPPRAALSLHLNEPVTSMVAADGQTDRQSWVLRENRLKIAAACVWDVSPEPRQPLMGLRPPRSLGTACPGHGVRGHQFGMPRKGPNWGRLGISAVPRAGLQQPGNQPTQDETPALGAPELPSLGGGSHGDSVQTGVTPRGFRGLSHPVAPGGWTWQGGESNRHQEPPRCYQQSTEHRRMGRTG